MRTCCLIVAPVPWLAHAAKACARRAAAVLGRFELSRRRDILSFWAFVAGMARPGGVTWRLPDDRRTMREPGG
jgi:hypothetical protein